jgi:hypothetical protein
MHSELTRAHTDISDVVRNRVNEVVAELVQLVVLVFQLVTHLAHERLFGRSRLRRL